MTIETLDIDRLVREVVRRLTEANQGDAGRAVVARPTRHHGGQVEQEDDREADILAIRLEDGREQGQHDHGDHGARHLTARAQAGGDPDRDGMGARRHGDARVYAPSRGGAGVAAAGR